MRKFSVLIFSSIICVSCHSAAPKAELARAETPELEQEAVPVVDSAAKQAPAVKAVFNKEMPQKYGYLEWDSILINNKIPLSTNRRFAEKLLGKPDSVKIARGENDCPNCHFCSASDSSQKYFFKGLLYEGLKDSLVFWEADFIKSPKLFLVSGVVKLDRTTTYERAREFFPNSPGGKTKNMNGYSYWIALSPTKELHDGHFSLLFDDKGFLIKFEYWFPC